MLVVICMTAASGSFKQLACLKKEDSNSWKTEQNLHIDHQLHVGDDRLCQRYIEPGA